MAKAETEIVVSENIDKIRGIIMDLKELGTCFKFVEKVSEDGKIWFVKAPMSGITRTKELSAILMKKDPVEWEARGEHLLWKGGFELGEIDEGTRIRVWLSVEGLGNMATIINPMAGMQIGGQLKYFIKELRKKLESH